MHICMYVCICEFMSVGMYVWMYTYVIESMRHTYTYLNNLL